MEYAKEWQLYGKLPTFDCFKCHNAIGQSKCPHCGNRVTVEQREEIIRKADSKSLNA